MKKGAVDSIQGDRGGLPGEFIFLFLSRVPTLFQKVSFVGFVHLMLVLPVVILKPFKKKLCSTVETIENASMRKNITWKPVFTAVTIIRSIL